MNQLNWQSKEWNSRVVNFTNRKRRKKKQQLMVALSILILFIVPIFKYDSLFLTNQNQSYSQLSEDEMYEDLLVSYIYEDY